MLQLWKRRVTVLGDLDNTQYSGYHVETGFRHGSRYCLVSRFNSGHKKI